MTQDELHKAVREITETALVEARKYLAAFQETREALRTMEGKVINARVETIVKEHLKKRGHTHPNVSYDTAYGNGPRLCVWGHRGGGDPAFLAPNLPEYNNQLHVRLAAHKGDRFSLAWFDAENRSPNGVSAREQYLASNAPQDLAACAAEYLTARAALKGALAEAPDAYRFEEQIKKQECYL